MPILSRRKLFWSQAYYRSSGAVAAATVLTNEAPTMALSGGNLTATATSTPAIGGNARSTTSHASGKFYFEVAMTTVGVVGQSGAGILNSSELTTNYLGRTNNSCGVIPGNPSVAYINAIQVNGNYGNHSSFPLTIGFAVDVTAGRLYTTFNGSTWYGSTSGTPDADPVAGTLGLNISAVSGALLAGVELDTSGDVATAAFSGFAYTPPTGYGGF